MHTIKTVQTDGGGEFTSRMFTSFLSKCGIKHRLTCLYMSQQNGIVERKHRHIVETGLCLMSKTNVPYQFWLEAFNTAVHLINRLPMRQYNFISPYQKLLLIQPDYQLKVFGCSCFPHIRQYNSHKLMPRSIHYIFLGYDSCRKGYRCMDLVSGPVYTSRHVVFDEHPFPLQQSLTVTGSSLHSLLASPPAHVPVSEHHSVHTHTVPFIDRSTATTSIHVHAEPVTPAHPHTASNVAGPSHPSSFILREIKF